MPIWNAVIKSTNDNLSISYEIIELRLVNHEVGTAYYGIGSN